MEPQETQIEHLHNSMELHAHILTECTNISMLTTRNIKLKLELNKKLNGTDHA